MPLAPGEKLLVLIHEDDELLVIDKPAGLVCHPTKTDEFSSLISRVRLYLGTSAVAHLVNRLDRETSGVTIVAKRDETARALRRLWEIRSVEKEYLAIVHGHLRDDSGTVDAPLGKDEASRVAVKDCVRADGLPSQTNFYVQKRFSRPEGDFTLVRVLPLTGRKHQIRIHLAHIGHPIVGDKLYGGDEDLYLALVEDRLSETQRQQLIFSNHALHARAVTFQWKEAQRTFLTSPDRHFEDFASR